MARRTNNKPSRGPGRDTPRSRTIARSTQRTSKRGAVSETTGSIKKPKPTKISRGIGLTNRAIIMIALVALLALGYAGSLRVYFNLRTDIAQTNAEIDKRKTHISELEDEIERWKDPDFIRAQARSRLGWVVPGETGYRVIGPDGKLISKGATFEGLSSDDAHDVWWQRLWGSVQVADNPSPEQLKKANPSQPSPQPSPTR